MEELFEAASEVPESERTQWLETYCPDPGLRLELVTLLAFTGNEGEYIASVVSGAAARVASESDPEERLIGQHLGPYRIDSIIGHGGMGAVYLAVRDDRQYSQRVAIKLARSSTSNRLGVSRGVPEIGQVVLCGSAALREIRTNPNGERLAPPLWLARRSRQGEIYLTQRRRAAKNTSRKR